jgi:uncharacterized membrane protein
MNVVSYFGTWLAIAGSILAIDAVWLGFVARNFYREQIGFLMRDDIWFGTAALFYIFYAVGVMVLAVIPAAKSGSVWQAVMLGAVLGFCAYGTYDATNLATLKGWPVIVSIVDVIWGMCITATASAIGYFAFTALR